MPAAYLDNLQILKAIDERQQQAEGRPLRISAHQLLNEISGTFAADPRLMPGFLQELFIARAVGADGPAESAVGCGAVVRRRGAGICRAGRRGAEEAWGALLFTTLMKRSGCGGRI